ncbi:MAG: Lrp/AsnC family transcriptional regulator [Melioribacteraceae bacterium]|nr:Lrp/AsnC family transcriptional regulator [Melioribacteraceae bacterium]
MLDDLDIKLLNILQVDGRTKRSSLAEAIGLSLPSLSERLRKLENKGVIEGYFTKLNKKIFGYDALAFITVVMDSSEESGSIRGLVDTTPQIIECHSILGKGSFILKVVVKDTAALEELLGQIQAWPGVVRTNTSFVLSTLKETTKIEI